MTGEAWRALDWDVRTRVPALLRAAGLQEHAAIIASLPPLTGFEAIRELREPARAAALAAHGAWLARKPPMGSLACTTARAAAVEASKSTMLLAAPAQLPIAQALQTLPAELRAVVTAATGDAEGAADWSAATAACGDFGTTDTDAWARPRARLAPVVEEIKASWR